MTEKKTDRMILCSQTFTGCQSFDLQTCQRWELSSQGQYFPTGYNGSGYQERSTVTMNV